MTFVPFKIGRLPYGNTIDPDRLRQMADFLNAMIDVNGDFLLGDITIGRGGGKVYTNAALGRDVLRLNTTGTNNTGVGNDVLKDNTTGDGNAGFGSGTLYANTTGDYNVALGFQSLYANTTGIGNFASGYQSLYSNTTSSYNVATGYQSLYSNTTGDDNVAIGFQSLYTNTTGIDNIALGFQSLYFSTTGIRNVATGYASLGKNTTGNYNVASGSFAGFHHADGVTALTDPENSIYIGANSRGFNNSDNNSIVIGYQAIGEGANTTVIGNSSTTAAHIYGAVTVGGLVIDDAKNIVLNTTTGTKIGTATSQKLGLWNATPVVQPTTAVTAAAFTANSSGIADDTATFGGYTIGQIVAALKAIGALA